MHSSLTALARARGLGAARSGTRNFWRQRVTSIAGLPLTIATVVLVASCAGVDHATVMGRLGHPLAALVLALTILNFTVHMWIGMQVIIEDYVHGVVAKILLLIANTGFSAIIGVAGMFALVRIAVLA